MNRINQLFKKQAQEILNVYFTAGYPKLDDTVSIAKALADAGADIIEIGIPYSDPVADGPTIQASNKVALDQGMTLKLLLTQLKEVRQTTEIPVILMGYFNVVLQYGVENFCKQCQEVGVDGVIFPDLPIDFFEQHYAATFKKYGLQNIYLITPQTSEDRIRYIDKQSDGFIYMVSSAATTGSQQGISEAQRQYFERIQAMNLNNPTLIGFGISDHQSFKVASSYANGAIIGSQFIKTISAEGCNPEVINQFVSKIKG